MSENTPNNNPNIVTPQSAAAGPQPEPIQSQPPTLPDSLMSSSPATPVVDGSVNAATSPSGQPAASASSAPTPEPGVMPSQPQVFGPQQSVAMPSAVQSPSEYHSPATPSHYAGAKQPEPAKRKLPGKKLFIGLAAVLLVGFGGSAFAYINIMNNSPEKVLADAYANTMADLVNRKPAQVVGALRLASTEGSSPYSVDIDLEAKQVDENGQIGATVHVKVGESFDLTVTGNAIIEGSEAVYVKFDNLQKTSDQIVAMNPEFAQPAQIIKPLIQKIEGRWIKIDKESLKELGLNETKVDVDECAESLKSLRISDEDKGRFKEIFKQNPFAIASEELPAEKVDGETSYHYKLDLNEEASIRFAKEAIELESFAGVREKCEFKQEDLDKALKELQQQKEDQEVGTKPVFELWVGKKTRYVTKIKITVDDKEMSAEWTATTKINDQDIKIDIPNDAMSVKDVQQEIEKLASQAADPGMTQGWNAWRR